MKNITHIVLHFDNLEEIMIPAKYIGFFEMSNISEEYHRFSSEFISKLKIAHTIVIEFKNTFSDFMYFSNLSQQNESAVKRINKVYDISQISLINEDNKEELITADWGEDNWFNSYQKVDILEDGRIIIVIDKEKNIDDFLENFDDLGGK